MLDPSIGTVRGPRLSPTPYNIYPTFDSTPDRQSAFTQELERVAHGPVKRITGARNRLLLWVASLTPAQASELRRNPAVRALNVDQPQQVSWERETAEVTPQSSNCPPENCSLRKRDGDIMMQGNSPDELTMFSQAGGTSLSELPGYVFDSKGGQGITVYVIDSGINPNHQEFRLMKGSIRWLYLPNEPEVESDDLGHGTCVTSKVASPTFGVAKNANIVVVKIAPIEGKVHTSRIIAGWGVVASDIESNNMQGKAVISVSMGVHRNGLTPDDLTTYIASIRDLIELDVPIIVASGNRDVVAGPGLPLVSYPALLRNQLPLVVVGGVDIFGLYAEYSKGTATELTVAAMGRVYCANRLGGISTREGTSFAAPAVAGLAAYLMSLDQYRERLQVPGSVARNVRDLIRSLAYARVSQQPAVVWNGLDSRDYYCPAAAQRRDAGSPGCPALNTTVPPPNSHPNVTATPNSISLPSSITTDLSATTSSSNMTAGNAPPITTDFPTTSSSTIIGVNVAPITTDLSATSMTAGNAPPITTDFPTTSSSTIISVIVAPITTDFPVTALLKSLLLPSIDSSSTMAGNAQS